MNRFLRFGLIAAAVLAVLAGACVALPFLLPMSAYKAEIEAAGSRATGRALEIAGPLRITLFPAVGIEARSVSLANVPGGVAAHLAEADDVRMALRVLPLLQGRIDIAAIALSHPRLHFEVDKEGEANWTLTRLHTGQKHAAHLPSDLHIESIAIDDGQVSYENAHAGIARTLDTLHAALTLPVTDRSARAHGTFSDHGTPFTFDAGLSDTRALLAGDTTNVALSLGSSVLTSSFKGRFARNGDTDGDIALDTPSLRNLIALFGRPVSVPGGLEHLALHGHIAHGPHLVTLSDAVLQLDGMTMKGHLAIATAEHVPDITGQIDIDHLDLNPYLGAPHAHHGGGEPHEDGWSAAPVNLAVLKAANADLQLDVGSLDIRKLHVGPSKLNVKLQDARLSADLPQASVYGGSGSATLSVDASGPVASLSNRLSFSHLAIKPLLADTIGVDRIEGTGTVTLDVSAHGASADAIMHTLSGHGSVALANGRLRGVNLGSIGHTVENVLGGGAISDDALTAFSTMGGSFALVRGVLDTNDFHLANSVIVANGAGVVDLGNRTMDFRIVPRPVLQQSDERAGGEGQNYGVAVPIHITGPWNHLHFGANFTNVVTGVLQNLENGRAPFKDLFGHTDHDDNGQQKTHKSVGDVLKNMFGIH
jgi:AsmA protein